MKVTEFMRSNSQNYSSRKELIRAAIDAGYSYKQAYNAMADIQVSKNPITFGETPLNTGNNTEKQTVGIIGLNEEQFRQKYDIKHIITQAAIKLQRGNYIAEVDFIRSCNLKSGGYKQHVDNAEFAKYKGRAGGIIYWSHPDSISKLKQEGILI